MGTVVQFPGRTGGRFPPGTRDDFERLVPRVRGASPLRFVVDASAAESCHFANGLTVSWERECGLVLADPVSGYIDRGPFCSVDEVCLLAAYLAP